MKSLQIWLKKNIGLTVGLVISLAVLGWISLQLWDAYDREDAAKEKIKTVSQQLKQMNLRKPYPNKENLDELTKINETISGTEEKVGVQGWMNSLCAATPKEVKKVQPSEFNPVILRRNGTLRDAVRQAGVELPEDFAFGFKRYIKEGKTPTDVKEISVLLTEWDTIETITHILVDDPSNRVSKIELVRRAGCGSEVADTTGTVNAGSGVSTGDFLGASIQDSPEEVARIIPFEFTFVSDTPALRTIINKLEKSGTGEVLADGAAEAEKEGKPFFVVRSVRVENNRYNEIIQGIRPDSLKKEHENMPVGPGAHVAKPNEPAVVFGKEKIQVTLRVDLVQFREPGSQTDQAEKPEKKSGKGKAGKRGPGNR